MAVAFVAAIGEADGSVTIAPSGTNRWLFGAIWDDGGGVLSGDMTFNTTETLSPITGGGSTTGQKIQTFTSDAQPSAASAALASPNFGEGGVAGLAVQGVNQTTPVGAVERIESSGATSLSDTVASATDHLVAAWISVNNLTSGFCTPAGDSPT